jgi:hypothetical protein
VTGGTTLLALMIALTIAMALGSLLGRISHERVAGRGVSNLLTEGRGAFLPYLIAVPLMETTRWAPWIIIGLVTGFSQAIAVSRWAARREGQWSRTLLGGVALGRSLAALVSARARARGAVIGTLALTLIHVIALEMLLAALQTDPPTHALERPLTIGAVLLKNMGADTFPVMALGVACLLVAEAASSWLFQHRYRRRE